MCNTITVKWQRRYIWLCHASFLTCNLSTLLCAAIILVFTSSKFLHRPATRCRQFQPISRRRMLRRPKRRPMRGRGQKLCEWMRKEALWPMTMMTTMKWGIVIGWTGCTCRSVSFCCCAFSTSTRHSTVSLRLWASSSSSTCECLLSSLILVHYLNISLQHFFLITFSNIYNESVFNLHLQHRAVKKLKNIPIWQMRILI